MKKLRILCIVVLIAAYSLSACGPNLGAKSTGSPTDQSDGEPVLTGKVWKWMGFTDPLQSFQIDQPERYTIQFNSDGSMNIKADCNSGTAEFTLDGNSIRIEPGRMTLMACDPTSHSDKFLQYLNAAAIYFFKGEELFIDLKMDGGTMRFGP